MARTRMWVVLGLIVSTTGLVQAEQKATLARTRKLAAKQDTPPVVPPLIGGLAVRLQPDGTLVGTIGYIDSNNLELVGIADFEYRFEQNRQVIARGKSGPNGEILVEGLSPRAVYSMYGNGAAGGRPWVVACGIAVFGPEGAGSAAVKGRSPAQLASLRKIIALERFAQPAAGIAAVPAPGADSSAVIGSAALNRPGGGGGGGGGAGHGAGLAALAGLAAFAAVDNDDSLASPFVTNGRARVPEDDKAQKSEGNDK